MTWPDGLDKGSRHADFQNKNMQSRTDHSDTYPDRGEREMVKAEEGETDADEQIEFSRVLD